MTVTPLNPVPARAASEGIRHDNDPTLEGPMNRKVKGSETVDDPRAIDRSEEVRAERSPSRQGDQAGDLVDDYA